MEVCIHGFPPCSDNHSISFDSSCLIFGQNVPSYCNCQESQTSNFYTQQVFHSSSKQTFLHERYRWGQSRRSFHRSGQSDWGTARRPSVHVRPWFRPRNRQHIRNTWKILKVLNNKMVLAWLVAQEQSTVKEGQVCSCGLVVEFAIRRFHVLPRSTSW